MHTRDDNIRLEVICGPMFAGKTTELLRRIEHAREAGERVLVVKPTLDTRYAAHELVTHTNVRVAAIGISHVNEVAQHAQDFDTIAIDELHFFGGEATAAIERLRANGQRVIVAGCDIDHFGEPFAPFDVLIPLATEVLRLSGSCARCGAPSTHSERLVANSSRIIVGGIGDFEATCARCFRPMAR
jgi:thymidine kinase